MGAVEAESATVAVHDIAVKGNALVLGTHGRGVWVLDQLNAIREWSAGVEAKAAHLFAAAPVTAWRRDRRVADRYAGANRRRARRSCTG